MVLWGKYRHFWLRYTGKKISCFLVTQSMFSSWRNSIYFAHIGAYCKRITIGQYSLTSLTTYLFKHERTPSGHAITLTIGVCLLLQPCFPVGATLFWIGPVALVWYIHRCWNHKRNTTETHQRSIKRRDQQWINGQMSFTIGMEVSDCRIFSHLT